MGSICSCSTSTEVEVKVKDKKDKCKIANSKMDKKTPEQNTQRRHKKTQEQNTQRRHKKTQEASSRTGNYNEIEKPVMEWQTYYPISKNPGTCMIININKYDDNSGFIDRHGSELDVAIIKDVFSKLNFRVWYYSNLTATNIFEFISNFGRSDPQGDMFVCFIMGYGVNGGVYGSDGRLQKFQDIMAPLTPENCPNLKEKPKLFFVQAGRENSITADGDRNSHFDIGHASTPLDFMFLHSTRKDYVSFRDTTKGSPFIIELCKIIEEYHKELNLNEIFQRLQIVMQQIPVLGQIDMLPEMNSRLTRNVALHHELFDTLKSRPQPDLRKKFYPISKNPGTCLIININKYHDDKMPKREGSLYDVNNITRVFTKLNFKVQPHFDLKAREILKVIFDFAYSDPQGDMLICFIMGHGANDGVYGSDGKLQRIRDLEGPLNSVNCESLANKPKLFFVQACRCEFSDHSSIAFDSQPILPIYSPHDADFQFCYATTQGNIAIRNTGSGSPFIASVCKTVDEYHEQWDLSEIMLEVNRDLRDRTLYREHDNMPFHMVSENRGTLSYKVALHHKLLQHFN